MGFLRFWRPGGRGGDGEEQRSQQAQNQAHLFGLRSLGRRFRKHWFALCRLFPQTIALPVYGLGRLLDYLHAALHRLAELTSCLALVALLVLIVVLKSVMQIPDLEGIDD